MRGVLVTPALAAVVEALEAERLAPVPRSTRVVGADVGDLALILSHARSAAVLPGEVAAACQRLERAIRSHAIRPGSGTRRAR